MSPTPVEWWGFPIVPRPTFPPVPALVSSLRGRLKPQGAVFSKKEKALCVPDPSAMRVTGALSPW